MNEQITQYGKRSGFSLEWRREKEWIWEVEEKE